MNFHLRPALAVVEPDGSELCFDCDLAPITDLGLLAEEQPMVHGDVNWRDADEMFAFIYEDPSYTRH